MNLVMDVDEETREMHSYLPHELIVSEILVRLPVKSLMRFTCVCKAWRDTVSGDTSFSEAHTRRHRWQNMKPSSLVIAPYIRTVYHQDAYSDPEYVTPGLHLWEVNQRSDGVPTRFLPNEDWFWTRHGLAHCDGLVMMLNAEGIVRVLNPATRRSLTLPRSPNCATCLCWRYEGQVQNTFGFGRDPRSGAYKVARFFHREILGRPFPTCNLGMEVFTIGKDGYWRETVMKPPSPFLAGRTATFFKDSLIWTVDVDSPSYEEILYDDYGTMVMFVRFSLEDESFSVLEAPRRYPGPEYEMFRLTELHGQLAMACPNNESVEIWMCDHVDAVNPPEWIERHVLEFPNWSSTRLVAVFGGGLVFQDKSDCLWLQTSQGSKHMVDMNTLRFSGIDIDTLDEYSSFNGFDVISYIPTLVSI